MYIAAGGGGGGECMWMFLCDAGTIEYRPTSMTRINRVIKTWRNGSNQGRLHTFKYETTSWICLRSHLYIRRIPIYVYAIAYKIREKISYSFAHSTRRSDGVVRIQTSANEAANDRNVKQNRILNWEEEEKIECFSYFSVISFVYNVRCLPVISCMYFSTDIPAPSLFYTLRLKFSFYF